MASTLSPFASWQAHTSVCHSQHGATGASGGGAEGGSGCGGDGGREGFGAEKGLELRKRGVGTALSAAMIPPQEASARRREIEDKLKQVKPRRK